MAKADRPATGGAARATAARLGREMPLLLLALGALQIGIVFLASGRGTRALSVEQPVADLATLAGERLRPDDGALVLPAGAQNGSTVRLASFGPRPGSPHLLTVRAAPGLPFLVRSVQGVRGRVTRSWEVPARAAASEHHIRVSPRDLPPGNRLEIANPRPFAVVILDLEVRQLRRAHRWLAAAARPAGILLLALFALRHRRALGDHFAHPGDRSPLDALIAGVVLLGCFHVFLAAPVQQIEDSRFSTAVSHQLIHHGRLSLPDDFEPARELHRRYQLQRIGDKIYHLYPDAVPILNAPLVAVGEWLGLTVLSDDGRFLRHHEHVLLVFAAALQAAALCALLFLLGRLLLPPGPALALTGLFAFGTQIFSTVSRAYWSHAWALLLLTAALLLLLAPRWRERAWAAAAGATLLSWSFFCRPPMSLAVVGVSVYLLVTRRRQLGVFFLTGLVWAALLAVYSLTTFDQLVPPYFLSRHLETGALGVETLRASYPAALAGTLFSPGRGLFVFVPFLALVLWLVARHRRRLPDRLLAATAIAVLLVHWQLVSANRWWWRGGFGPRLFADVLPWLFLLAAMVWPIWRRRLGRAWPAALRLALAALLVGASLFIHSRGAYSRATFRAQGDPLWDWRRPPFLAGLTHQPGPPTLGQRLARLRQREDPVLRARLREILWHGDQVAKRWIEVDRTIAAFVTWDGWTYGEAPAALIAFNPSPQPATVRVGLASWAADGVYPITVRVEDGERTATHRLANPGEITVDLGVLRPGERRLYIVWSDKAWTPGGDDMRRLGVQLRPPPPDPP